MTCKVTGRLHDSGYGVTDRGSAFTPCGKPPPIRTRLVDEWILRLDDSLSSPGVQLDRRAFHFVHVVHVLFGASVDDYSGHPVGATSTGLLDLTSSSR